MNVMTEKMNRDEWNEVDEVKRLTKRIRKLIPETGYCFPNKDL